MVHLTLKLAMFKPDEAACLLAERFNIIGWIYKQEPIMFNRLASRLAALPTWTRPLFQSVWVINQKKEFFKLINQRMLPSIC